MKYLNVFLMAALMAAAQSASALTVETGGSLIYDAGLTGNSLRINQIYFTVATAGTVTIDSTSDFVRSTSSSAGYLFLFDESDTLIANPDEDFPRGHYDSHISRVLDPGNYMVTIGIAESTYQNAIDGSDDRARKGWEGIWTVTVTTPSVAEVPLPAALPLFFSAVTGLLLSRRRKQS